MANYRMKDLRGPDRRNFLRLMGVAGAAFALERSKLLNFLADEGGVALADDAACASVNRSVHISAGNGSYGWYQLLWPHIEIAQADNPSFAYHSDSASTLIEGVMELSIKRPFEWIWSFSIVSSTNAAS